MATPAEQLQCVQVKWGPRLCVGQVCERIFENILQTISHQDFVPEY